MPAKDPGHLGITHPRGSPILSAAGRRRLPHSVVSPASTALGEPRLLPLVLLHQKS
jgi:hypothetical protein